MAYTFNKTKEGILNNVSTLRGCLLRNRRSKFYLQKTVFLLRYVTAIKIQTLIMIKHKDMGDWKFNESMNSCY